MVDDILRGRGFPSFSPGIGGFEFERVNDDGRLAVNESDGALDTFEMAAVAFGAKLWLEAP